MKFKSMCETHWEWISCVMHDCVTGNFFFLLKLYHTNIYLNMLHIYCSINCWHRTRNWWNFAWTICAAPHFSHEVPNILKVTFPNQWTGKARSHTHTHTHMHHSLMIVRAWLRWQWSAQWHESGEVHVPAHVLIPFPWNQSQKFQTGVLKWVIMWQKFQTSRFMNIKTLLYIVKAS